MKISLKNLGPIKEAEFALGDLTIICGQNNTGKTYVTYALYGFLSYWRNLLGWRSLSLELSEEENHVLLNEGSVQIDIEKYAERAVSNLGKICAEYNKKLPQVFDSPKGLFAKSQYEVHFPFDREELKNSAFKVDFTFIIANMGYFSFVKEQGSTLVKISLPAGKNITQEGMEIMRQLIGQYLKKIIFPSFDGVCFIASVERTGIAIFRKELDSSRDELLEKIKASGKVLEEAGFRENDYYNYAYPIKDNIAFDRRLGSLAEESSFLEKSHPDFFEKFKDILGGAYLLHGSDLLAYIPKGTDKVLSMNASSSSVRSLLYLNFYLRHVVQKGDILIIDEPELNLHPENQRRIARLFARLINLGVKVFITTHSDYIIKELNTLIMLNHDSPQLKKIAEEEGYKKEELISAKQVRVYIAEKSKENDPAVEGNGMTLTPAVIDEEMGIEARSFDSVIEKMNQIQSKIVWREGDDD